MLRSLTNYSLQFYLRFRVNVHCQFRYSTSPFESGQQTDWKKSETKAKGFFHYIQLAGKYAGSVTNLAVPNRLKTDLKCGDGENALLSLLAGSIFFLSCHI